jgi:hypothetical protein
MGSLPEDSLLIWRFLGKREGLTSRFGFRTRKEKRPKHRCGRRLNWHSAMKVGSSSYPYLKGASNVFLDVIARSLFRRLDLAQPGLSAVQGRAHGAICADKALALDLPDAAMLAVLFVQDHNEDLLAPVRALGAEGKPTHTAYVVRESKEEGRWLEVGAAWPHRDAKGFDIVLMALPVDGRLVVRLNEQQQD